MMAIQIRALFLGLLFSLLFFSSIFAQQKEAISDSALKVMMNQTFKELEESNYSEDVQRKYADFYFDYYMNQPNEKYSEWAIAQSFNLWAGAGAAAKMDSAMAQLDYDSEIWSQFLFAIFNGYYKSEDRTRQDFILLFEELREKLTHPVSKSSVLWTLARRYKEDGKRGEVKALAQEIVDLDANEFYATKGHGLLYEMESLKIGQEAPSFQAETVQGETLSLAGQTGKIVILEFWATWCGPCKPEIPHLKLIDETYPNDKVQVIGISLDKELTKLEDFIAEEEMKWPQIIQQSMWDGEIPKKYNVVGVPRSYIIGPDGKILAKDIRGEELEKKIAELVSE